MQKQNRQFFDTLGWDGWHGNDRPIVDGEDKDVDTMLDELRRRTDDRLSEYEDSQEFTKPSRERREARQKAEYKLSKLPGAPANSGTHG